MPYLMNWRCWSDGWQQKHILINNLPKNIFNFKLLPPKAKFHQKWYLHTREKIETSREKTCFFVFLRGPLFWGDIFQPPSMVFVPVIILNTITSYKFMVTSVCSFHVLLSYTCSAPSLVWQTKAKLLVQTQGSNPRRKALYIKES